MGMPVLVVDDEADIAGILADRLETMGLEVQVAHDGEEALQAARLKNEKPKCHVELVKVDLSDTFARDRLFCKVNKEANRVLILSEGLLIYFTEMEVAALADSLHKNRNFDWWLLDYVSPATLAFLKYSFRGQLACVPLNFAPKEGYKFFMEKGWRVCLRKSLWDEARRLKREMPWMRSIRSNVSASTKLINRFRWNDACVLLQRSRGFEHRRREATVRV